MAQAQGKHRDALDKFRISMKIFTELGARWDVASLFSEMGRSNFAMDNDSEAEHFWCESLHLAMETHGISIAMESILGIAGFHAKHGNDKYALKLLLFVSDHPRSIPKTKVRAEKMAAELKENLSAEEIESAKILARESVVEDVVKEILGKGNELPS